MKHLKKRTKENYSIHNSVKNSKIPRYEFNQEIKGHNKSYNTFERNQRRQK